MRAASSIVATPPDERITSGSGRPALALARAARAGTARRPGRDTRRGGGRRPLVLAKLGRHLVRRDDVARRDSGGATPPPPSTSCAGSRNEKRRQTAIASGRRARASTSGRGASATPSGPIRSAHTDTALERHERLGMVDVEPVEMRTILPPQVQQVLESRVATKAVRAPLRSSSAFVATVVPCVKRSTAGSPACSSTSAAAATTDSSCAGASAPSPSCSLPSVEQGGVGERAADVDAEDRHRCIRPHAAPIEADEAGPPLRT